MRSAAEISSIVADAKINYSYRIQLYETLKERGISTEDWSVLFGADNLIELIESGIATTAEQSLCCDWLIKNNFTLNHNYVLFTEAGFTDSNFDTL